MLSEIATKCALYVFGVMGRLGTTTRGNASAARNPGKDGPTHPFLSRCLGKLIFRIREDRADFCCNIYLDSIGDYRLLWPGERGRGKSYLAMILVSLAIESYLHLGSRSPSQIVQTKRPVLCRSGRRRLHSSPGLPALISSVMLS